MRLPYRKNNIVKRRFVRGFWDLENTKGHARQNENAIPLWSAFAIQNSIFDRFVQIPDTLCILNGV